jgi:DNA-binding response OmpR family regulator
MKARILIVEDEPRLRELLRLYLERDGHAVAEAADGATALATFERDGADLVVLDLMLPGLQGEAVLDAIRQAGDVPVLSPAPRRRMPSGLQACDWERMTTWPSPSIRTS